MIEFFIGQIEQMDGGFAELMKDRYGNYFCQELMLSCSSEQ